MSLGEDAVDMTVQGTRRTMLDRIIALENYAEMIEELRPRELAVVALRLEGLTYAAAAELLGITSGAAYARMARARRRLRVLFPHIQRVVGDS
ncbi:MAG: sigma factor-like helix-turn-helix DNA-binding protein [Anaerolineae bacterium]